MDVFLEAVRLWQEGQRDDSIQALVPALDTRVVLELRVREALDHRNQGRYEMAQTILGRAFHDAGGGTQLGEILHHMGTVFQGEKRFEDALETLRAAFLVRTLAQDNLGAAYTAFQIPMCHYIFDISREELLEEFKKARERIIDVLDKQGHDLEPLHLGNLWQNVAFCHQMEKNYPEALVVYDRVLKLRVQAKDDRGRAMTLARIAECQLEIGNLDEADDSAKEALKTFQEIEDKNRIAQVEKTLQAIAEARVA